MGFYLNAGNGRLPEHAPSNDPPSGGLVHQLSRMFLDLGRRSERLGELGSALTLYEKAVVTQPTSALAWYNYGDVLLALKRPEEAISALLKAVELSPDVPLFHYDLGLAFYQVQRYEEAGKEFAGIVSEDPQLKHASSGLVMSAMTNLALNEDMLGRPQQALEILAPTIPTATQILYNVGRLNLKAKQPATALRFLQAAALISPNEEDTIHGIGCALMELRRYQEAMPYLRRATKLNPRCETAWYALGVTLSRLKQNEKARSCFRKTISLNPQHAWAFYATACLDALQRKSSSAFTNLEKAISNGFSDVAYLKRDTDFRSLRRDPKWRAIVTQLSAHSLT